MEKASIDNLAKTLVESLPEGLRAVGGDIESTFRSVLNSSLRKMDLVTREEFDVQQAVLQRTREKLDAIEARLAEFEKDIQEKNG